MFQNSLRVEQTQDMSRGSAAPMQSGTPAPGEESGLAQLSRMLQERYPSLEEEVVFGERPDRQVRPVDSAVVSTIPLRASPIEGIPIDREPEQGVVRPDVMVRPGANVTVQQVSPTASAPPSVAWEPQQHMERSDVIAYPSANLVTQQVSPVIQQVSEHPGQANETADASINLAQPVSFAVPTSPASLTSPPIEREPEQRVELSNATVPSSANPVQQLSSTAPAKRTPPPPPQPTTGPVYTEQGKGTTSSAGQPRQSEEEDETEKDRALVQQVQAVLQRQGPIRRRSEDEASAASDNTLLDIVQSLPPMASPPPQQQALSGRATRPLGSVLLEGHLVPQDRLEVAQNIQRMLRGVDMSYQLGEILLMFKLLTHDQLLAASLVSYGMITTTQIRALGRIRQELYSIGLEYDLENLLILFRILSPEQVREVRASWSG